MVDRPDEGPMQKTAVLVHDIYEHSKYQFFGSEPTPDQMEKRGAIFATQVLSLCEMK